MPVQPPNQDSIQMQAAQHHPQLQAILVQELEVFQGQSPPLRALVLLLISHRRRPRRLRPSQCRRRHQASSRTAGCSPDLHQAMLQVGLHLLKLPLPPLLLLGSEKALQKICQALNDWVGAFHLARARLVALQVVAAGALPIQKLKRLVYRVPRFSPVAINRRVFELAPARSFVERRHLRPVVAQATGVRRLESVDKMTGPVPWHAAGRPPA